MPIVLDRAERYPDAGLERVLAQLLKARAAIEPLHALHLISAVMHFVSDSYPDIHDNDLSEALDWVDRPARAWRASHRAK